MVLGLGSEEGDDDDAEAVEVKDDAILSETETTL